MKILFLTIFILSTHQNGIARATNHVDLSKILVISDEFKVQNSIIEKDAQSFSANIKDVIYQETSSGAYHVIYKFHRELRLLPNETVYFVVPKHISKYAIASITLSHRQDPYDQRGSSFGRDNFPAYTSVQVHDVDDPNNNNWKIWAGHASWKRGAKFAEIRRFPENDNLYDWPLIGHRDLQTQKKSHAPLRTDLIKVEALGVDPVYISELSLKLVPPRSKKYFEISYTHSPTVIGDPMTFAGRNYGGGPRYRGHYPGAIKLSPYNNKTFEIDVDSKKLETIRIAIGDTKPDGIPNKDGTIGTLGGAKVSIGVKDKNDKVTVLVDRENVAPKGIVTAFNYNSSVSLKSILIIIHSDSAYLMGVQYGHN